MLPPENCFTLYHKVVRLVTTSAILRDANGFEFLVSFIIAPCSLLSIFHIRRHASGKKYFSFLPIHFDRLFYVPRLSDLMYKTLDIGAVSMVLSDTSHNVVRLSDWTSGRFYRTCDIRPLVLRLRAIYY